MDYYDEAANQADSQQRERSNADRLHPRSDEFAHALHQYELRLEDTTFYFTTEAFFLSDIPPARRFSFHDGIIAEICPDDGENNWVLNLKKGVLSMLQNSMFRFDIDHKGVETDVAGTCQVTYRMLGANGTGLLMYKEKDIKTCTQRYKTNSILQTVPYDFRQVSDDDNKNEFNLITIITLISELCCLANFDIDQQL